MASIDRPFEEGDIVQLDAGGPAMTVKVRLDDLLLCEWHGDDARPRRATFNAASLRLANTSMPLWACVALKLISRSRTVAVCELARAERDGAAQLEQEPRPSSAVAYPGMTIQD